MNVFRDIFGASDETKENENPNLNSSEQHLEGKDSVQVNTESENEFSSGSSDEEANMESFRPPPQMSFEGNLKNNWNVWYQKYKIYMQASGLDSKSEERQVAVLLHVIGDQGQEKFSTFDLSDTDKKSIKKVIEAFENFCIPKANETVERFLFFTRSQEEGENFTNFLTDLKKLSASCGFGNLKDSLIKDRIVIGIHDEDLQRRLLKEEELNLEKCVSMCKTAELAKHQVKIINDENNKIHILRTRSTEKDNKESRERVANHQQPQSRNCSRCGGVHKPRQCPAYGKKCAKCARPNHFASVCRSANKAVETLETHTDVTEERDESDGLFIGAIDSSTHTNEWRESINVNKRHTIEAKLDSGAQCNSISLEIFDKIKTKNTVLKPTKTKVSVYGGSRVRVVGTADVLCKFNNRNKSVLKFLVVEGKQVHFPTVIGLPTLIRLNLVARVDSVNIQDITEDRDVRELLAKYNDVFTGSGFINGFEYEIKLKEKYVPKIHPCRRVPIALMDTLKRKLEVMEKSGIIKKVNEPTEWVHPLVLAKKKDGNLRICLDPTDLNQYIEKEPQQIPSFDELTSNMANAKVFSTLDADSAFWQIKITDKSSDLLTFSTPFGRYKFLGMAYGILSASEIFQTVFMEIFGDIPGVGIYIDDIKISAKDTAEHNRILAQVFERARKYNVRFNLSKCTFSRSQIKYMGHILTDEGIALDQNRVKAITEMPPPKNKEQLETFLGMVTYVSKFIPNFSQSSAVLRDLTKKNNIWNWDANTQAAFENIKNLLVKAPVLKYFDVTRPLTLSVDASQSGLGAVLIQENLPVAYASRALTPTECRYAQIEKEALAIAFGCKRFHQYIYGKNVLVESDHKPLETIFKKPLNMCPARIQRIKLSVQKYDLRVTYKPGKELLLADALSRSPLNDTSNADELLEMQVCTISQDLPISVEKKQEFVNETRNDPEMQLLAKFITNGWPHNKDNVPSTIKAYHTFHEELSIIDNLIFKGERLIVPKNLRKMILDKIHYCHLGIQKSKLRAREIVYWPGMNTEIETLVGNCAACSRYANSNIKEPLMVRKIPDGPWQTIGVDLFHFKGEDYLLVIDYYTKYVEVAKLVSTDSAHTIARLKSMFARFGIPGETVYSDNGPQFNSCEMKKFAREWNFTHSTSSPIYPQSNGMVERYIQTVKNIFKKVECDNKDPALALLEYRNTPIDVGTKSPNELMFGRKVRGIVPILAHQTTPNVQQHTKFLEKRQLIQKRYYDKNSHVQKQAKVNDKVYVQTKNKDPLKPGRIVGTCDRPRSFQIELENGKHLERNRRHLHLKKENNTQPCFDDDSISLNNSDKCSSINADINSNTKEISQHVTTDSSSTNPSEDNNIQAQPILTRSGRVVKTPQYLQDYVT